MKKLSVSVLVLAAIAAVIWVLFFSAPQEPQTIQEKQVTSTESLAKLPEPELMRGSEPTPRVEAPRVELNREEVRAPLAAGPGEGIIVGRIVEADGAVPVPNFKVEAYGSDMRMGRPDMGSWFEEKNFVPNFRSGGTMTDPEGKFTLRGLSPKGLYILGLGFGGPRPQMRFLDHVPNAGETINLGDIALEPFVTFTGRVIDSTGAGVPEARVRASILPAIAFAAGIAEIEPKGAILVLDSSKKMVFTAPGWMQQLLEKFPVPTTYTDSQGNFRLEGVQIGMATVIVNKVDKPIFQQGPIATGKSGEKNLGDLKMEDGETVEGKVLDSTKKPIAGAEVFVGPKSSMAPAAILHPVGKTDEQGRFKAKGFKSVTSYAIARIDEASPWGYSEEFVPGADDALVTVETGYDLTVFMKDSAGQIIQNGDVLLKSAIAAQEFPVLFPPVSLQGRVERQKDGALKITRLNPGEYMLICRAPGYALTMQQASLMQGSSLVEVLLPNAAKAKVLVTDKATNQPIHNAYVSVRAADSRFWTVSLSAASTNSSGEAMFTNLAPGAYYFETSHPQYATFTATATAPVEVVQIGMDGGGSLEGRVHQAGRNIDSPRMLVLESRGQRTMLVLPRITSTDLEGKYRITNLEPGEYRVHVQGRLINQGTMDLMKMMQGGPEQKSAKVDVSAGKTTMLDIDLSTSSVDGPAGRLTGRVSINGRAAANVTVMTWNDGRRSATTDAGGYFELPQVKAGQNWVSISLPAPDGQIEPYRLGSRDVDVKENETTEVNWDFNTGVLRGKVTRKLNGKPVSYATVTGNVQIGDAKKPENSFVRTRTNDHGEFVFDPAPAGKWTISVRQQGTAPPSITTELKEGEDKSGIEIQLEEAVKVSGKITLPAGTKADWIWMQFYTENRRQGTGASVDKDKYTFTCDTIGPGKYTVQLNTWTEDGTNNTQWETQTLEVPDGGLSGVVLNFNPKSIEPPKQN